MAHATPSAAGLSSSQSSRTDRDLSSSACIPSVENLISEHNNTGDGDDGNRSAADMDSKIRTSTDAKPHAAAAAAEADHQEHTLTFLEAIKLYPTAVGWSLFVSLGVIMLAFDPQIVGSMYAMPQFQKDFGYEHNGEVGNSSIIYPYLARIVGH